MNPYLQQSANNIATNLTQNWQQNALPAINSGAMMAGGFGGSRQGVAQGISANGLNQAIGQAQTSLYGNAYEGDQNRATQQSMQQAQLAAQQQIASMQNQTQRDLGFGNLGLGYMQANNQYSLGQGNLALGNKQADQSYGLGQFNAQTQRDLGMGNLDLGRTQAQNQYNLGLGNLGLGQMQTQNQYNLGLGQLGLGQYNAETSRGLGYGQLQQQGEQNAFNNQQAGFNSQLNALNSLMGWNNQGVQLANQQAQLPLQNLGMLANIGAGIGGQGSTISQPGPSTVGSALGGALTAAQLWQLLSGGKP